MVLGAIKEREHSMEKLKNNIYHTFNLINNRLNHLEEKLAELDEKLDLALQVERSHLLRIKNKEQVSDDFILRGLGYYDLSPENAYEIFEDKNRDFIFLDVSKKDYRAHDEIAEAIKIPLEELAIRHNEIVNKNVSILVISEKGVRSILACELLNRCGFFNVNNISGGYKFWPGFKKAENSKSEKEKQAS